MVALDVLEGTNVRGKAGRGDRGGKKKKVAPRENRNAGSYDARFKPPAKGAPRVRNIGDVVNYLCGTCRCWTKPPNRQAQRHRKSRRITVEDIKEDKSEQNNTSFAAILTYYG